MYTILVCDDERDIVSALEIYLTVEGYRVLKAYNGKEALSVAAREDVLLLTVTPENRGALLRDLVQWAGQEKQ